MAHDIDYLKKQYTSCHLCPKNCGIDRTAGQTGSCKETDRIMAARAALHFWEEPCISGSSGSGAVFFSGCPLRCIFCQNREISTGEAARSISRDRLSEIFLELQDKGANNINLVTAVHFAPDVAYALERAKEHGLRIPVLYNSSGYESLETLRIFDGLIDIYLPDMKYVDSRLSQKYSRTSDYFDKASKALEEMVRQTGQPEFYLKEKLAGKSDTGKHLISASDYNYICDDIPEGTELMMRKGTIVRHLILPGCTFDSKAVIRYLYDTYRDDIFISIMNQFTPMHFLRDECPELYRKVTDSEYDEVIDYAIGLGINNAFIQEGSAAAESFIPAFDFEGL